MPFLSHDAMFLVPAALLATVLALLLAPSTFRTDADAMTRRLTV